MRTGLWKRIRTSRKENESTPEIHKPLEKLSVNENDSSDKETEISTIYKYRKREQLRDMRRGKTRSKETEQSWPVQQT